eukprot:TRINITY_DN16051_c0_g1_i1.p2 TRINITY_DN16051_c0_g1~~TRINITY_DN16051_c0_g1_i1.p2  ORF type:complete len:102 (+),score=6.42 TRINITY_DN16051_c0_g1_i1:167-472(+)
MHRPQVGETHHICVLLAQRLLDFKAIQCYRRHRKGHLSSFEDSAKKVKVELPELKQAWKTCSHSRAIVKQLQVQSRRYSYQTVSFLRQPMRVARRHRNARW